MGQVLLGGLGDAVYKTFRLRLDTSAYVSQKGGGDIAGSRADNVPSPSQSLVPPQRGGGVEGPNSHLLNEA